MDERNALVDGLLSRRTFALLASISGLAVVGATSAEAGELLTADDEKALLSVAAVVAVVPVPFPVFDGGAAAATRVTKTRLTAVVGRLSNGRLGSVRAGARLLGPAVVDADRHATVVNVAKVARTRGAEVLVPPLALAVATLSDRFDPGSDAAAELWLSFAERYARRTTG